MKRIAITSLSLSVAVLAGCDKNIPLDRPEEECRPGVEEPPGGCNPAILGPRGIIQGVVNYIGPPPCFRNGLVEGQVVLLLFDAANPPPPDGLASTALNFATVPGEKLFANVPRPAKGTPGGAGNNQSFCPSVNTTPISASTNWSMQQVLGGRYQVRGFYSRQSRWTPLFNFANLSLAGDVAGGFVVDPRAAVTKFGTVEVGVPTVVTQDCIGKNDSTKPNADPRCVQQKTDADAGKLTIPESGFIRAGVPVSLGLILRSNRPFFSIDYANSTSFDPGTPDTDFNKNWGMQRKPLTGAQVAANGFITFPQDHLSTSQSKTLCLGTKGPECDAFEIAQASFPQIRFKYGFPGSADAPNTDAWLAKNAKPKDPFFADRMRPFYGIDPKEFEADIPTSGKFVLTRNFNAAGEPEILRDNQTLEELAQIADIFPSVVLSKLADDGDGNVAMPPRSQTDPIVVIQTITLKDWETTDPKFANKGSMKATSQGAVIGGALTDDTGKPDPNHPLAKRDGVVAQDGFTALIRPSVVCIYPQDDLRGTLVTPVTFDPNPDNIGAALVSREKILTTRANRVKNVQFGCLPPGYYSVNVVYPTGQAWSFPNLSGHCSYTARFAPNEDCMNVNAAFNGGPWWLAGPDGKGILGMQPFTAGAFNFTGVDPNKGFPARPLLRSQSLFKTDPDGKIMIGADGRPILQVVKITASTRCGQLDKAESELECANDAGCPMAPFSGVCIPGPGGKKFCDINGDGRISTAKGFVNNPMNEDIALNVGDKIDPKSANGILDLPGEDVNKNGKLDLHVPFTCMLPRNKWAVLPNDLLTK